MLPSDPDETGHVSERRLGESLGAASGFKISIAELLENVNGLFDDVISRDVAQHLDIERGSSEFTERLRYSLRASGADFFLEKNASKISRFING